MTGSKFVQLATCENHHGEEILYALDEDGDVWQMGRNVNGRVWYLLVAERREA